MFHITGGCKLGDSCPSYHCKSSNICIMHNTKDGCQRKGKCSYGHELIGKDACTAVLKYAEQKAAQNKANPNAKPLARPKSAAPTKGGGSKGGGSKGGGSKGGGSKGGGSKSDGNTDWRKDVPCKFFRANDSSACVRGDKCPYSHKKSNE